MNDPVPLGNDKTEPVKDAGDRVQLVERYLDQQNTELTVRAQELEVQRQKDEHAFDFGKAALAAQAEDRRHERDCKTQELRYRHRFIIILVVLLSLLVVGIILAGQPQIATEIAKAIGYLMAGGLGGYGYARSKPRNESEKPSDD